MSARHGQESLHVKKLNCNPITKFCGTYEEHVDGVVPVLDTFQEDAISGRLDTGTLNIISQQCETIKFVLDQTNLEANPTADGDNRGDGSSGSINHEGQLLTGNAKRVEDGKHGLANHEAVGVIVEEDETAREECGEKAGARRFGAPSQSIGKALDATCMMMWSMEARTKWMSIVQYNTLHSLQDTKKTSNTARTHIVRTTLFHDGNEASQEQRE